MTTTQTGREPEAPEPVSDDDGYTYDALAEQMKREVARTRAAEARAERAEAEVERLLTGLRTAAQGWSDTKAALERYRTTYREAAQAHHEWAADPIYGCEHCARVTAALRAGIATHGEPCGKGSGCEFIVMAEAALGHASTEEGAALADSPGEPT